VGLIVYIPAVVIYPLQLQAQSTKAKPSLSPTKRGRRALISYSKAMCIGDWLGVLFVLADLKSNTRL
jgi:hypothetical protein